jgi:FKBP-type peptidyl-prolyl cis-trans isomerase FkpA
VIPRLSPRRARALAAFLVFALAAGCSSATAPTDPVAFSQLDLRLGTGTEAATGNTLTVNYTGWLYDATKTDQKGIQFDTSVGRADFIFQLGVGQVIKGWDQGLVGMKIGGLRRLVVPPSLAYGEFRNGPIPPHSTLVFEIELLDVAAAAAAK